MVRVLAVNNYPSIERFDRLRDSLASNGAEVTSADWRGANGSTFNKFDGVVLSGSPDMLSEHNVRTKFAKELEAISETKAPLLGICFGLQLIGCAFGSTVVKNGPMIREYVDTDVLRPDGLFEWLPPKIRVFESHEEAVSPLPSGFILLARSKTSPIAAMRHSTRPIRGLQFHPERNGAETPHGNTVVANFVKGLG
ncbi:MAG: gamma-glutamyl-gamma-aminobutyrate hydrolase family protein [Nitrososphaerales archaeon]|nr:gamma-glutamyl-gamma-aminobutyrate hydrolase family protein [Nitrososphaerales archaeon]